MTEDDLNREAQLRADAETDVDASGVVADFYEERGQLTRAKMWRTEPYRLLATEDGESLLPPDLFAETSHWTRFDPRRNLMMWVTHFTVTLSSLARHFGISRERCRQIIDKQWREIALESSREALFPKTPATRRLVRVGALTPFDAKKRGEMPPDTWPVTRHREQDRAALRPEAPIARVKVRTEAPSANPSPLPSKLSTAPMSLRRKKQENAILCAACGSRPSMGFEFDQFGADNSLCQECAKR